MGKWDSFKSKFDEKLTKWEKKGFNRANASHKVGVRLLLLFLGWQFGSLLLDYNSYMLNLRQSAVTDDNDLTGPINKE